MLDYADPVPLTIDITDASNVPANAGLVVLTITLPDGTTTQPTISNPTPGRYQVDYQPTMPGRHSVSWVATGTNSSGFTDVFDVYDTAPNAIISFQDARSALRITSTTEDEDLRPYIEATTAIIERHKNEVVVRRIITEDHRVGDPSFGNYPGNYYGGGNVNTPSWYYQNNATYANSVALRRTPVISLTSVTSLDGSRTWNTTDLHLDTTTGLITPLPGTASIWGPLTIIYLAGYTVIPAHYQQAGKIILRHLWSTRRGDQSDRNRAIRQGDIRWAVGESGPGMEAALELLGPPVPVIA